MYCIIKDRLMKSRPAQARGLKQRDGGELVIKSPVAPRSGAWIEISMRLGKNTSIPVAPGEGAWIETGWTAN